MDSPADRIMAFLKCSVTNMDWDKMLCRSNENLLSRLPSDWKPTTGAQYHTKDSVQREQGRMSCIRNKCVRLDWWQEFLYPRMLQKQGHWGRREYEAFSPLGAEICSRCIWDSACGLRSSQKGELPLCDEGWRTFSTGRRSQAFWPHLFSSL
jgi:hypothetical protein